MKLHGLAEVFCLGCMAVIFYAIHFDTLWFKGASKTMFRDAPMFRNKVSTMVWFIVSVFALIGALILFVSRLI